MRFKHVLIYLSLVILAGCASEEGVRDGKSYRGPLPPDQNKCFATCPSMNMTPVYDTSTGSCSCKPN